jgi:alginate O-acetyltransferase complex protein AlgI
VLFSSFEFIFVFLPLVLLLYFQIRSHRARLLLLWVSSSLFYGFWNYKFVALLLFSTAVDFILGIQIHEAKNPRHRKLLLILSIVVNLGVLGFFKYFNFFMDNFYGVAHWFSPTLERHFVLDVVLPIGISFYTFISLSYTIDVYLKRALPHRDFFAYAGFVSFFPHLVAGPLIRHDELVFQLEDPKRGRFNATNFSHGILFFVMGLCKKILIADRLADGVNPVLETLPMLSSLEAWLCAFGYAFQLYFDFSGYSDMAVGLAKMMNIQFPQNFRSPYKARSITDFWQRWHISLSHWLRDYLYIPLGGNRLGTLLTYRNLFVTMFLGGLWHGANWVFLIWGSYHGLLLALERAAKGSSVSRWVGRVPLAFRIGFVFVGVTIGWVFFRSPDLSYSLQWLKLMFTFNPSFTLFHFEPKFRDRFFAALFFAFAVTWGGKNTWEINFDHLMKPRFAWLAAALMITCLAFFSKNSPFLYFQF